jgi:hypothetical protein
MTKLKQAEDDYLRSAELKLLSLPLQKRPRRDSDDNVTTHDDEWKRSRGPYEGVKVENESGKSELVIPTTEELRELISDPILAVIAKYRADIRQRLEEKSAIAEQTHALVMETMNKLDRDVEALERYVFQFRQGLLCVNL